MPVSPSPPRPSAFLVLVRRTFDDEPVALFSDRREARAHARAIAVSYDPAAAPRGEPSRGRDRRGPVCLRSRLQTVTVVPFVDGVPSKRCVSYTPSRELKGVRPDAR